MQSVRTSALLFSIALTAFPLRAATLRDAAVQTWVFQGQPMAISVEGEGFGSSGTLLVRVTPKNGRRGDFVINRSNPGRWLFGWHDDRIDLGFSPDYTAAMTPGSYTFQLQAQPASGSPSTMSRKFEILVLPGRRTFPSGLAAEFEEGRVDLNIPGALISTFLTTTPFRLSDAIKSDAIRGVGFKINDGASAIEEAELDDRRIAIHLRVKVKVSASNELAKWKDEIELKGKSNCVPSRATARSTSTPPATASAWRAWARCPARCEGPSMSTCARSRTSPRSVFRRWSIRCSTPRSRSSQTES